MIRHSEWNRYLSQAVHTLGSARRDIDDGDYAWACFKAQQAAGMVVKGFIRGSGGLATGHSVVQLLHAAVEELPEALTRCARELDKVYIPTRYPDVYDAGSPHEYFDRADALAHTECAGRIIDFFHQLVGNHEAGTD
jgi:HEPN domain-containing protein